MEKETKKVYTEADLVSFGNYLLSEERDNTIDNKTLSRMVGDWDIQNWEELKKKEKKYESADIRNHR